MAQERGEAASHSGVVRGSILGRRGGRQSAKEVVGPRGRAVVQQQPGSLQVLHERDSLEQAIVLLALLREPQTHVFVAAQGGAKDREPLLLRRERPIPHPDCGVSVPLQR